MGVMVIASYRPRAGKDGALRTLLKEHVSVLRDQGLVTDRPQLVMKSKEGVYLLIYEWVSDVAIADAQENLVVTELWQRLALVCEYAKLADLEAAHEPFAHFEPVEFE